MMDQVLHWTDWMNMDFGSLGRTQVVASTKLIQHPHAMAIFEDMIYYSDRRLYFLNLLLYIDSYLNLYWFVLAFV